MDSCQHSNKIHVKHFTTYYMKLPYMLHMLTIPATVLLICLCLLFCCRPLSVFDFQETIEPSFSNLMHEEMMAEELDKKSEGDTLY